MVGVRLEGRLGNQMFQYAIAYSLAKRNYTSFFMDQVKWSFFPRQYFVLPAYNHKMNSLRTKYFQWFNKGFKYYKEDFHFDIEKQKVYLLNGTFSDAPKLVNKNTYFDGYFQSEDYFSEYNDEIKKEFSLQQKHTIAFNKKYDGLYYAGKVMVIQLRLTDFKEHGNERFGGKDLTLPLRFYTEVINEERFDNFQKIVISDDIYEAKKLFADCKNLKFESNSEIIDFQLMLNADALIFSYSTFAWWAAYLNNKADKYVYAPKYWWGWKIKREYPPKVMQNLNWNWIEV